MSRTYVILLSVFAWYSASIVWGWLSAGSALASVSLLVSSVVLVVISVRNFKRGMDKEEAGYLALSRRRRTRADVEACGE